MCQQYVVDAEGVARVPVLTDSGDALIGGGELVLGGHPSKGRGLLAEAVKWVRAGASPIAGAGREAADAVGARGVLVAEVDCAADRACGELQSSAGSRAESRSRQSRAPQAVSVSADVHCGRQVKQA